MVAYPIRRDIESSSASDAPQEVPSASSLSLSRKTHALPNWALAIIIVASIFIVALIVCIPLLVRTRKHAARERQELKANEERRQMQTPGGTRYPPIGGRGGEEGSSIGELRAVSSEDIAHTIRESYFEEVQRGHPVR